MSAKGATGDPNDIWSYGPAGVTGPTGSVGSMYYDTSGNVIVNNGANWVTIGATSAAATYTVNSTTPYQYDPYNTADVVIRRPGKPEIKVGASLDAILERLCIIEPAFEKLEKYPALKAAYDNYKMIEALIKNDEGNEDE